MLAAFDGIALLVFSGLVGAAILLRRRGDYHKRLMLLATLSLLGPAFGRLTAYAKGLRGDSDIGVLLLCAGTVLACAVVDKVRSHRLHPAFFWGGVRYWHGCGHLRSQDYALERSQIDRFRGNRGAVRRRVLCSWQDFSLLIRSAAHRLHVSDVPRS
jgi:hypothetical protein